MFIVCKHYKNGKRKIFLPNHSKWFWESIVSTVFLVDRFISINSRSELVISPSVWDIQIWETKWDILTISIREGNIYPHFFCSKWGRKSKVCTTNFTHIVSLVTDPNNHVFRTLLTNIRNNKIRFQCRKIVPVVVCWIVRIVAPIYIVSVCSDTICILPSIRSTWSVSICTWIIVRSIVRRIGIWCIVIDWSIGIVNGRWTWIRGTGIIWICPAILIVVWISVTRSTWVWVVSIWRVSRSRIPNCPVISTSPEIACNVWGLIVGWKIWIHNRSISAQGILIVFRIGFLYYSLPFDTDCYSGCSSIKSTKIHLSYINISTCPCKGLNWSNCSFDSFKIWSSKCYKDISGINRSIGAITDRESICRVGRLNNIWKIKINCGISKSIKWGKNWKWRKK